jgi:uncharacterized membrane protein YdjX (TVP38/TMEM64 family)
VVNAIGLVFAALAGYALARRTAHLLELERNIQRLPPYVRRFKVGSPAFLLSLRLIPGLGGTLATQIAATFRVPLLTHVWTMCAIAVPICTLLAIFGDRVSEAVHAYYVLHGPHVHIPHVHMHLRDRIDGLMHDHGPHSHPTAAR